MAAADPHESLRRRFRWRLPARFSIAEESVHVYTSPHLVRFHERIRLGSPEGGAFVDEDRLAAT
ncbi:hypothetical protein ACIKTA_18875, partial [Hansschlegelia beijingensis]